MSKPLQDHASILIVDDRPENLKLLVQILDDHGYDTRPALNAQVALGAVEYTQPDLILLDIRMPEMDGFELCKRLKSVKKTRDVPIIFISALEDIDEKVKAFQAGGVDYISRPFQKAEVLARVQTHIELSKMRQQMETIVQERTQELEYKTSQLEEAIKVRQETEKRLRQSQKMEAVGRIAGGIAHEFNNVLGIIIGNTELAEDDLSKNHPVQNNLQEIKLASLRAKNVIKQLLNASHKAHLQRRPVEIGPVITQTLKLIRASLPSSIKIVEDIATKPKIVNADTNQLQQLLINLCTNAFQAMDKKGSTLTISLHHTILEDFKAIRHADLKPGEYAVLRFSDDGRGIDPNIKDKIFDPYFTTQEFGQGTGMGLSVVQGIVQNHGGAIEVESEVGVGSTFKIYLPCSQDQIHAAPVSERPIPTGNEKILFVDDEPSIGKAARSILTRLGYDVTVENNPLEALSKFRSTPEGYDLVITDMTMPMLTGEELAREILKNRSDLPIIICTGRSKRMNEKTALDIGIRHYVEKPLEKHEIARLIRKALDN
jgi:DNA-binding response OmpR family regulator